MTSACKTRGAESRVTFVSETCNCPALRQNMIISFVRVWLSPLGLLWAFFPPPIMVFWGMGEKNKPSRREGTMPVPWQYPGMSPCLECNEDIVLLFVNEKHHDVLLWSENVPCHCSSSASSNGAPQRYRAVLWLWDKITRNPKKKKKWLKRGGAGDSESEEEGWANCAQSPWQPLYHAAAVPAANISRLTQPRTFPPQRNTHTVMYKHIRLFNRALACVWVHVEICSVCQC